MPLTTPSPSCVVAGHLTDGHREGADSGGHLGIAVPHRQHLLVGLVVPESLSQVATARPALPDLLRHVRIHGRGLHRWAEVCVFVFVCVCVCVCVCVFVCVCVCVYCVKTLYCIAVPL